ncbi:hypothetical protein [Frateuria aurantia]|nr:hypothetical protein [Frateuria aurantia]
MTVLERMARDICASTGSHRLIKDEVISGRYTPENFACIMAALTKAPPGWKLVPEQLTEAMDVAAYLDEQNPNAFPSTIWRTFLAAAPEYKEGE